MEEDDAMLPFSSKAHENCVSHRRASNRLSFWPKANSGVVLAILIVTGVLVSAAMVVVLLSLGKVVRPEIFKKSWDSLNLVLVLFAVITGFLSRLSDGGNREEDGVKSVPATLERWFEDNYDQRLSRTSSLSRLKSHRSYSDIPQESSPAWFDKEPFRFYDDDDLFSRDSSRQRVSPSTGDVISTWKNEVEEASSPTSRATILAPSRQEARKKKTSNDTGEVKKSLRREIQAQAKDLADPDQWQSSSSTLSTKHEMKKPVITTPKHEVEDERDAEAVPQWIPVPPPPPPPYNKPVWRLIHDGDFVRLVSIRSSHEESPHSGEATPIPDVDGKADKFIARERANRSLEQFSSLL